MSPPTLWRIARAPYADLTGEGARRFGGRWNPVGVSMLYASTSLSLAVVGGISLQSSVAAVACPDCVD